MANSFEFHKAALANPENDAFLVGHARAIDCLVQFYGELREERELAKFLGETKESPYAMRSHYTEYKKLCGRHGISYTDLGSFKQYMNREHAY